MLVQGRVGHRRWPVLYTSVALFSFYNLSAAHADWAESLGIGQKSTNLGGAVTATSDDYDAFYTNPAGAANFTRPFFGAGAKIEDVRGLNVTQSGVASIPAQPSLLGLTPCNTSGLCTVQPLNGLSLSPTGAFPNSTLAALPSLGAYSPLPGWERVVVGIGVGSPFNVASVYGNTGVPGNYGQFNTSAAGLAIVEVSPTVAVKVTDRLNLGATVGITTMKSLQMSSQSGAATANLPIFGQTSLGALGIGSMNLQTGSNITTPFGPSFATGPIDAPSVTLGAQYKFTDQLTGGVTWRSATPETFNGIASLNVNQMSGALGTLPAYSASDQFRYKIELPQDIQIGLAYGVTPKWKVMGDVRWTNWGNSEGFGTPGTISLLNGTINPGAAIASQTSTLATLLKGSLNTNPFQSITTAYDAHDTFSLHFGTSYKLTSNFEVQAGYVYDPSFISKNTEDLTTLSSNRHIFSLGGTYTIPTATGGEWALTAGAQLVDYEKRHIDVNESTTLGGINGLAAVLSGSAGSSGLTYTPNSLGGIDISGYVWSVGASVSYRF